MRSKERPKDCKRISWAYFFATIYDDELIACRSQGGKWDDPTVQKSPQNILALMSTHAYMTSGGLSIRQTETVT